MRVFAFLGVIGGIMPPGYVRCKLVGYEVRSGRACIDTGIHLVRIYIQRALGRLLSAAREQAPTQVRFHNLRTFHSGPELSGTWATTEGRFMPRKLTSLTTLDNLRKEAKRWLTALRENDAEVRERFERAYPKASANPVLLDVQHALAREHGLENWKELKLALQKDSAEGALTARFLEFACPDHHVRGPGAPRMPRHAPIRLLHQTPPTAPAPFSPPHV